MATPFWWCFCWVVCLFWFGTATLVSFLGLCCLVREFVKVQWLTAIKHNGYHIANALLLLSLCLDNLESLDSSRTPWYRNFTITNHLFLVLLALTPRTCSAKTQGQPRQPSIDGIWANIEVWSFHNKNCSTCWMGAVRWTTNIWLLDQPSKRNVRQLVASQLLAQRTTKPHTRTHHFFSTRLFPQCL